jgi:hypothetical protein
MRVIDTREFRSWTDQRGLLWREEWPQRPEFGLNPVECAWPWPRPQGCTRHGWLADFILAAMTAAALEQPGGWYLWPRDGRWKAGGNQPYYRVRNAILGGLGIRVGNHGAAHFKVGEADDLAAAMYACCFMFDDCEGSAADQFDVFPQHGQLGLHFVDEEMFWAQAASKEPLERFNGELVRAGWGWLRDGSKNDFVFPAAVEDWTAQEDAWLLAHRALVRPVPGEENLHWKRMGS